MVFGSATGVGTNGVLDLATLDGTNGFRLDGIDGYDVSGRSVSSAGDVNGDGFDDVIVGAGGADPNGNSGAGESYVVFGSATGVGTNGVLDLAALDGTNGFRLDGIDAGDRSGYSVSSAGDVNGDGFDDVIVGAYSADPNGDISAGESYVVFGSSTGIGVNGTLDLGSLNGTNGFRLDGIDASDISGRSVSSAGDVNGDGFDDVIVGAGGADPNGNSNAGESYVVFGFATRITDGSAGDDLLVGTDGNDIVNGFGGDDRLEGGERRDTLDGGAGFDTAFYGNATSGIGLGLSGGGFLGEAEGDTFIGIEAVTGSFFSDAIIGNGFDNTLDGGGGNDFLVGQGGDDILIGGAGGDRLEGGAGADAHIGGSGFDLAFYRNATSGGVTVRLAGVSEGGDAEGDTYVSVEQATGTFFNDVLLGTSGTNGLSGGGGDDLLNGGEGDDFLFGSVGADRFAFTLNHGNDRVLDFTDGEDRLDYSFHDGVSSFADLQVFNFNGDAIVQDGQGGQVVLTGAAGQVDASDFLF